MRHARTPALAGVHALLIDIDGVLYVEDEPVAGARDALARLRASGLGVRFLTNTTARSRARTLDKLRRLDCEVADGELVTPPQGSASSCGSARARGVPARPRDRGT